MPAAHDAGAARYPGLPAQGADGGPPPPAGNPDAEATQFMAPVTDRPEERRARRRTVLRPRTGTGSRPPSSTISSAARAATRARSAPPSSSPASSIRSPPRPRPARAGRWWRSAGRPWGRRRRPERQYGVEGAAHRGGRCRSRRPGHRRGRAARQRGRQRQEQPVSATAPASEEPAAEAEASPTVDPVRQQAEELDKLLAVSGDSRTAVINAVADVKACRNLDQAAKDLRDAADQRNQLVTDLSDIEVDKLPDHQALSTALTKAWQASASADDHYAAWADQVAGKKGCRKGQARTTGQTQAGNRASGTATEEKTKAAALWNTIARQHGLTERQPTQL
ncbi:hypothetical protein ACR6C2_20795 [Streptomyces sp. INA 01156]